MATSPKTPAMSIDELMRDGRAIAAAAKRAVRRAVAELDRESAADAAAKKKAKSRRSARPAAAGARGKAGKPVLTAATKSRSTTKRRAA